MLNMYLQRQFKFDLVAAIVVAIVAIPLCLGIALASGAPIFSGILSGIIGGIVVGSISGSAVSVSGPAAGMAAIVVVAITQLGGFNTFLLALMLAGILQILIGSFRVGFIADYVPSNVVQGLLCAIGILLILKELPLAFTHPNTLLELKVELLDITESFKLASIYSLLDHINFEAMMITGISCVILLLCDASKKSLFTKIPAPIVVVVAGVLINQILSYFDSIFTQSNVYLVQLPTYTGYVDLFHKHLQFPQWSAWQDSQIYFYALLIAVVTSLETLLNIEAGEKLDKKKRVCSKNRELIAQGCGNVIAGFLGGIPITSVIVRTSVNIQAGAKTKISAILHGILLLFASLLIPYWLNKIPLASLAAILIFTGYKLTNPKIYVSVYQQGRDRFIPFIATVLGIVFFNVLMGIIIGLIISMFYILKNNSQARIDIFNEIYPNGVTKRLLLPQQITFLSKAALIAELESIPYGTQLIIDACYCKYMDKEIIELIKEFQRDHAPNRQIALNLVGFEKRYEIHNHINFINVTTFDVQCKLAPHAVLKILLEGNQRFINDTRIHRSSKIDIKNTAKTQHPIAVILGCIDSRVPVETVFDVGFGDVFCVRIAGNIVNNDILASIEYACHVIGAKLIVVLGHTKCGAISSACDNVQMGHITQLLEKIQPALVAEIMTSTNRSSSNGNFVDNITKLNIATSLQQIYTQSKLLQSLIIKEEIGLVGALYNIESGRVTFDNYSNELNKICPASSAVLVEKIKKII